MPARKVTSGKPRTLVEDLRGAGRLAVEATRGVTDLVEAMHLHIASGPAVLGRPLAGLAGAFTGPVYRGLRGATRLAGAGVDAALGRLAPLLGEGTEQGGALRAALNGVLGDHLAATGNPLAIELRLCSGGRPLTLEPEALRRAFPRAGGRVLVLVHGSCRDERWSRDGHDHGEALARDVGVTPVYVRYNSGLHVSVNGRALAGLLEALAAAWPVPLDEVAILGHSMGGLVARSACHAGEEAGHAWRRKLRTLVCLGTPHHGAPLERAGHGIDLLLGLSGYSAPLARLGRIRSAGVTDLRHGNVCDEDWQGRDRFALAGDRRVALPLPGGVRCYAVAATRATRSGAQAAGDGLVPVESALGRHRRPERTLGFPRGHLWVCKDTDHLGLLGSRAVYRKLRSWLAA